MDNSSHTPKKKKGSSGTQYDDAFHTMLNDCPNLLIPLINEVFGREFKGNEKIIRHSNEHYKHKLDQSLEKKVSDAVFTIVGILQERYLIECQSTNDNTMVVRIVEYSMLSAIDSADVNNMGITLDIPKAAVLYLRSTKSTPDNWRVELRTPGGTVSYIIPTIKLLNYNLETILSKKLYFLLPFYVFNKEKLIKEGEEDENKLKELLEEVSNIIRKINILMDKGELSAYQRIVILEMLKYVTINLIGARAKVKKGVSALMGIRILNYRGKEIYNEGITKGIEQGIEKGKYELLVALVQKGKLTIQEAAEVANVSEKEFNLKMEGK